MGRFGDSVAVVTGGGNGIGRACCVRFGEEGAAVVVADRDVAGAEATVAMVTEAGGTAVAFELDATSRVDNDAMAQLAVDTWGRLDYLVTAAGVSHARYTGDRDDEVKWAMERAANADQPHLAVLSYDVDEFRTVLDINLIGTFLAAQACAARMVDLGSGGSIVTIASSHGARRPARRDR